MQRRRTQMNRQMEEYFDRSIDKQIEEVLRQEDQVLRQTDRQEEYLDI